jgi:hypothetical protein
MNKAEQQIKNVFLFFVACALFALPVFVYFNLVPVVDSSLSQNSLTNQDISNKERNIDEVEEKIAQVVKRENEDKKVLGVDNESSFGVNNFFDSSSIIKEEVLIDEEKTFFSVITIAPLVSDQSMIFDAYLINEYPKYKSINIEFGIAEDEFAGLEIMAVVNDNKYLVYDGTQLTKESEISLNSNEMVVLGFEISGEEKYPEIEKNISIKFDRL